MTSRVNESMDSRRPTSVLICSICFKSFLVLRKLEIAAGVESAVSDEQMAENKASWTQV